MEAIPSPAEVSSLRSELASERAAREKAEAERDEAREEWRPTFLRDAPHGSPEPCPTYYDGCHCTVGTLAHNIDRAETAERRAKEAEARATSVEKELERREASFAASYRDRCERLAAAEQRLEEARRHMQAIWACKGNGLGPCNECREHMSAALRALSTEGETEGGNR